MQFLFLGAVPDTKNKQATNLTAHAARVKRRLRAMAGVVTVELDAQEVPPTPADPTPLQLQDGCPTVGEAAD